MSDNSIDRFARTELLLGKDNLDKLRQSCVAVVGLGAVGSFALEVLARSGVGTFVLVDFDEVRQTNFNRQLLATEATLGKKKVAAAQERVLAINPECKVHALELFVDAETVKQVLALKPDVVIDAIDSVNPKTQLLTACVAAKIPVVSSMGAGNKLDPFKIKAGDISDTENCPLARVMRHNLKRLGITSGVRCVYSTEISAQRYAPAEKDFYQRGRLRRPIGSIAYMTGMFGMVVAGEVTRMIIHE